MSVERWCPIEPFCNKKREDEPCQDKDCLIRYPLMLNGVEISEAVDIEASRLYRRVGEALQRV